MIFIKYHLTLTMSMKLNKRIIFGILYSLSLTLIIVFFLIYNVIKFDLISATIITFIFTSFIPVWIFILNSKSSGNHT